MTVARTTEISATSNQSFDDAIRQGVERATRTLDNVKSVWVKDQELELDDGQVANYKVHMKATFVLNE